MIVLSVLLMSVSFSISIVGMAYSQRQLPIMSDPLEHAAGELQQAMGGTVWFEDAYSTAYYTEEE